MKPEAGFILVVDDNEANRDVLSRRLKRQGHNVAVAEHGRQALDMLQVQAFDLILLDIMMPEMNGYEVLEQLKNNPALRHIPVIMISALDDLESVVRCVELGAEDYLYKPFNPVLLRARVGASLEKKWLRDQEQAHLQSIRRELELGQRIQADFLPGHMPQCDGWDIGSTFQPAREVAGDFYDAFSLSNNHLGLVIADVCDKGVGAALFMALIRSLIRAFAEQVVGTPTESLKDVSMTNTYIARHHHNRNSRTYMFATLFFGVLNPANGNLSYINAGHEPPLILNQQGIKTMLEPTGPAVGLSAESTFHIGQTTLEQGDMLFAYTDGITEARAGRELFGEERLFGLLQDLPASSADLMQRIQEHITAYMNHATPTDDITMLTIHRLP